MLANSLGYDFCACEENVVWDEKIAKSLKISPARRRELESSLVETIEGIKRSCFTEFHHR